MNQSQSNALPTESEKGTLQHRQRMKELELREKQQRSLLNNNSTIEKLLEALKIPASIAVLYLVAQSLIDQNKPLITSMGSGCAVPPSLKTKLFIPEPFPIIDDPTYREQIEWDGDREQQLIIFAERLLSDRDDIRAICKEDAS